MITGIFVDTSGLLAMMNADDEHHVRAKSAWIECVSGDAGLITTNYILIETTALLQARIGMKAVAALSDDIQPVLAIQWIDESIHAAALAALMTSMRRRLSLVDCASFECMRRLGIRRAFSLDSHFRERGFDCVPRI